MGGGKAVQSTLGKINSNILDLIKKKDTG